MSTFFKSKKKVKAAELPAPRSLEEIMKEYQPLKVTAGDIQYQIFALGKNLARINEEMERLNYEGAARQKLDAEAAKAQQTEKEASNG